MIRRAALAGVAALAAAPALAQLGGLSGRTGVRGNRRGVDEALRRTVSLVLRAEARRGALPPEMSDPQPLSPEQEALLMVGAVLPDDFPATPVPEAINRRLPHARGGSVWIAAGFTLIELDPTRLRVLSVAPDVLPPQL